MYPTQKSNWQKELEELRKLSNSERWERGVALLLKCKEGDIIIVEHWSGKPKFAKFIRAFKGSREILLFDYQIFGEEVDTGHYGWTFFRKATKEEIGTTVSKLEKEIQFLREPLIRNQ